MHIFTPGMFFLHYVFPYLICVGLAYGGARIMVTLGADVSRARDLGSYRLVERPFSVKDALGAAECFLMFAVFSTRLRVSGGLTKYGGEVVPNRRRGLVESETQAAARTRHRAAATL